MMRTSLFVPLTIVPSEQITGTPGATLTDALLTKPGIIGSTFAPGADRPVIRGFDIFPVLVQEGGIGSHDVSALSEDHVVRFDWDATPGEHELMCRATDANGDTQPIGGCPELC
jgi:iron complex outermembrane receptor protein